MSSSTTPSKRSTRTPGKSFFQKVSEAHAARAVQKSIRREHGYIPSRTSHRIVPFKTTKIYNSKLLATHLFDEDPTVSKELQLTVSDILSSINQLGTADLKIVAIKAFVDSPTTSIAEPLFLSFEDGFSSLGGFSETMTTELVRDFTSQTLVASVHPPLDDWLRDTAQIRLGQFKKTASVRVELAVQIRTTLPTLTFAEI